jgi:hypothetical protein
LTAEAETLTIRHYGPKTSTKTILSIVPGGNNLPGDVVPADKGGRNRVVEVSPAQGTGAEESCIKGRRPIGHLRRFDYGTEDVFAHYGGLPDYVRAGVEGYGSAIWLERGKGARVPQTNDQ